MNYSCVILPGNHETGQLYIETIFFVKLQSQETPVLGLGLGVDFTFSWDNNNNINNKNKNPNLNFLKGTVQGDKEQRVGVINEMTVL